MFSAVMAPILGATGAMDVSTSAEPLNDVCERFPCLAVINSGDAMIEAVVETLKVECPSPPVPTMSHLILN